MNKNILFLISFCFFVGTFCSQAQDNRYGFRLGLNYSNIDFEDGSVIPGGGGSDRIGFTAGFFARYRLSDNFSIQPEIQYSAQGEKSTSTTDNSGIIGQNAEDPLKINIIQVPVLINYTIKDKFTFSLGPQIGLGIWEWERRDDYETVQFSAVGGIGYNITSNISVEARAVFGITDAIDSDNSNSRIVDGIELEPLFRASGVNHYLQFTVAYSL